MRHVRCCAGTYKMPEAITYIYRHPLPQYHSIETVFNTVVQAIAKQMVVEKHFVPYAGALPHLVLGNLLSVKPDSRQCYHVTGDVTYMGIRLGSRCVLTVHDVQSALSGHPLKRRLIKWFWFQWPARRVPFITVISEFSKRELVAIIPSQAHKIQVVPNPVDPAFRPVTKVFRSDGPVILCMGTKSNKNLERIITAVAALPCTLHIVGKLQPGQLDMLQQYGVTYKNNVQLHKADIVKAYQSADMLCFPSTYEGFGMPIIEAQASGIPVITSNLGAMKEVAGDGACLVDPYSEASIRAGVLKIIYQSNYREQLIQNGLKNVQRFTLEHIAQQYQSLYKQMKSS